MTEQQVPAVKTVVGPQHLYAVLRAAWRTQVQTEPRRTSLLVLLAQWSLETGGGGACIAWNLGNIKHVPGDGHDYALFRTWEILRGQRVELDQTFRAYATLEEGAADYLATIRGRFGYAWPAVENGDVEDFAHKLKLRGYYTAPERDYAAGLRARYTALDAQIEDDTAPKLADVLGAARAGHAFGLADDGGDPPDAA